MEKNKTSRRWIFSMEYPMEASALEACFRLSPKVRFSAYCVCAHTYTPAGYIELRAPVKITGIKKILGEHVYLSIPSQERETVIRSVASMFCAMYGPFFYGERDLKKGGRPRLKPPQKNISPDLLQLSTYMDTPDGFIQTKLSYFKH
ncbi:hypothetical protein NECID01_0573 [Nematocida sp. AWRm77]|nr:hypothetical protein NECID01_0573 [Nematocida sp. AWRm77]